MASKDYERPSFKEILDILDPDLSAEFKKSSYYHNDFRKKLFNKDNPSSHNHNRGKKLVDVSGPQNVNEILNSIKIVEPFIGNSDNYM